MNKLEEQMVHAIQNGTDFRMGNTLVLHENGMVSVFLHSNLIAVRNKIGNWLYSDGHYKVRSKTTKSRLNALGLPVFQMHKKWYVGDKKNYVPFVNDF